jgi:hypothetical protein
LRSSPQVYARANPHFACTLTPPVMTTSSPSCPRAAVCGRASDLAVLAVSALVIAASFSPIIAAPPPVNIAQPVEVVVKNAVEVQGSVETLNDAFYEPYRAFKTASTSGLNTGVQFDIPAGKRLVIETITLSISVLPGQKAAAYLQVTNELPPFYLTVESQGVFFEREQFAGTHPVKLRIDGPESGSAFTIGVARTTVGENMSIVASVAGYLVPL